MLRKVLLKKKGLFMYIPLRMNKQSATANLYDVLMVRSFTTKNNDYIKLRLQEIIYEYNIDLYKFLKVKKDATS
jgi:uncharacterized protein (UPF0305 family)